MKAPIYQPGQELGGVRILELRREGPSLDTTWYRVSRTCCGEVLLLTHSQIAARERRNTGACRECKKASARPRIESIGVMVPAGSMRGWWPSLSWRQP